MTRPDGRLLRYYDALKRIASYEDPEWILKHGENQWGLPGRECLIMSYENVLDEARRAVKGRKRPKP